MGARIEAGQSRLAAQLMNRHTHVGLQPRLAGWAAAALIHQIPTRKLQVSADKFCRLAKLLLVIAVLRHRQRNAMRRKQDVEPVATRRWKTIQRVTDPRRRRFYKTRMVIEHSQLVDLRRPGTHLNTSCLDILQVLSATGVRAIRRGDVCQCPPSAISRHLPDRACQEGVPIPIAPVNWQADVPPLQLVVKCSDQLPQLRVDRAHALEMVIMLRHLKHPLAWDRLAPEDVFQERNYVVAGFGSTERDDQYARRSRHLTCVATIRRARQNDSWENGHASSRSPRENDPDGTRTRVAAVKGRCPRPLDDGASYSPAVS